MEQQFTEAFYLTGATILGIGLILLGGLLLSVCTDTRTYYQIRGIHHNNKWIYTIDKMIQFGKPNDQVSYEKNYFVVWFRDKEQAEAYLNTLNNTGFKPK